MDLRKRQHALRGWHEDDGTTVGSRSVHCIGSVVGVLCVHRAESSFRHQLLDDLAGHRNHSHPTRDLQRPTGGQMFPVSYRMSLLL